MSRPRIVIDGQFDDWRDVPVLARFPAPAPSLSVAPLSIRAADDGHYWYLSIALRDTVALSAMPGTMHLLIDADDNATTGGRAYDTPGIDLSLDLSRLDKLQSRRHGAGFALRNANASGLTAYRSAYHRAVVALPSWGADTFELRVARTDSISGVPPFSNRMQVRAVFVSRDSIVSATARVPYTFATRLDTSMPARAQSLPAKAPGAVRIAHWNVSEGSFEQPLTHAKLLAAVAPDIIVLDEIHGSVDSTELAAFFALPELKRLGEWHFAFGRSGGRQRGVVATYGRALRAEPSMRYMRYPEGSLDSLARTDTLFTSRVTESERSAQIASTGVWVNVDGVETLFVPVDLTSGGYVGSPNDAFRLLQARTIRDYVHTALGNVKPPSAVVIAGDFNSVGSYSSVDVLRRSAASGRSVLAMNSALRLDGRTSTTWRNDSVAQFVPGRLDLALYTPEAFTQTGGFVFATEDLTDSLLRSLGLTREMSRGVSDHLIVVTDIRRR